jgi:hypothetical protein
MAEPITISGPMPVFINHNHDELPPGKAMMRMDAMGKGTIEIEMTAAHMSDLVDMYSSGYEMVGLSFVYIKAPRTRRFSRG